MGDTPAGRAGINVRHIRNGTAGTRSDRQALLKEAMRELDVRDVRKQAARNPNIVASLSSTNIPMVNDGNGSFRRPKDVGEILDYGDHRQARVFRKVSPKSFVTTTIVAHLPKTMCREVPYGRSDGERSTRWVPNDHAEMRRYFDELVAYLADDVLPGGHAAIHGYDINLDETTPHIQIIADTFGHDAKHEGRLRVMASHAWSSHREVVDADGRQKSGPSKLRDYQRGLRERMIARGFQVEPEVDSERSTESYDKPTYVALDNKKRRLDALIAVAQRDSDKVWQERASIKKQRDSLHESAEDMNRRRRELDDQRHYWEERNRAQEVRETELQAQQAEVQRVLEILRRRAEESEVELREIMEAARESAAITHEDENVPHVVWRYFDRNPKVASHFDVWARQHASLLHASDGPEAATALNGSTGNPFESHRRRLQRTKQQLMRDLALHDHAPIRDTPSRGEH